MKFKGISLALAVVCGALPVFASAQWSANVIHPAGYSGSAAGDPTAGGQVLGWSFPASMNEFHAGYWTKPGYNFTSLHQAGWLESSANAGDGVNQYGYIRPDAATGYLAAMWSGTAASYTSYHPDGFKQSSINSLSGGNLGGWVMGNDDKTHAVIWIGDRNTFTDLNPAGHDQSRLYGMQGGQQVGNTVDGGLTRAALWTGAAASYTDLGPANTTESDVFAVRDGWQAGWGLFNGDTRSSAVLWNGTAASALNLNPAGSSESALYDVQNGWQVGYADFGAGTHAGIWNGTSGSFEDLNGLLPAGFTSSAAISIEILPDVINIYGYGINSQQENWQAVVWSKPVPEPASMAALGLGVLGLLRRKRRVRD